MSDFLDAGLELLDRQVLDADGRMLGKVDDLRFDQPDDGSPPVLAAVLIGQRAFGQRLRGVPGRCWTAVADRLAGHGRPVEVPAERIREYGPALLLDAKASDFSGLGRAERWLSHAFIGKVPGAHREGK